ncbi:MAG: MBL fold metallo-hydrolase [Acinetobacter sp.]
MLTAWVQEFFDENSNTFSYVVTDPKTQKCAVIDSVLDYDAASASISTAHVDCILAFIQQNSLSVEWILETHVHADHLTAAQYIKEKTGGKIAIGHHIKQVQQVFSAIYNFDVKYFNAHQVFDHLFQDHESFKIGDLNAYCIPTPGHTPACLSYVVEDAVFVGDTLFMPDYGTARCDFPKGSASMLFDSVQQLFHLPEHMRVFLCHDYLPENRDRYQCETTIQEQKQGNVHIHQGVTKAEFVEMRTRRDASLSMPKLILPAIQINMNAGRMPEPESNGQRYLKLPLNYF